MAGGLTRWRCSEFLGLKLSESPPDRLHPFQNAATDRCPDSCRRLDWVLQRVGEAGLLKGKTLGIDATTLDRQCRECAASFDGIAGKGTTSFSRGWLKRLGIETPTRQVAGEVGPQAQEERIQPRVGNTRTIRMHRITKRRMGARIWHVKAEHAVDLETGAIVAAHGSRSGPGRYDDDGPTLIEAAENLEQVMPEDGAIQEVVADKGYHSTATMKEFKASGSVRSYVSEPDRGGRKWKGRSRRPGCRFRESAEGSWRART